QLLDAASQQLRPFGHGAGNLLEIGNAPLRAVPNQRGPPLLRRSRLWTATGLAYRRHPALRFLLLHLAKIHRFHLATRTAFPVTRQVSRCFVSPSVSEFCPNTCTR